MWRNLRDETFVHTIADIPSSPFATWMVAFPTKFKASVTKTMHKKSCQLIALTRAKSWLGLRTGQKQKMELKVGKLSPSLFNGNSTCEMGQKETRKWEMCCQRTKTQHIRIEVSIKLSERPTPCSACFQALNFWKLVNVFVPNPAATVVCAQLGGGVLPFWAVVDHEF